MQSTTSWRPWRISRSRRQDSTEASTGRHDTAARPLRHHRSPRRRNSRQPMRRQRPRRPSVWPTGWSGSRRRCWKRRCIATPALSSPSPRPCGSRGRPCTTNPAATVCVRAISTCGMRAARVRTRRNGAPDSKKPRDLQVMSLTSYRAAPSRGKSGYVKEGVREDIQFDIRLVDPAATYSPMP